MSPRADYERAAGAAAEKPEPVQPLESAGAGEILFITGLLLAGMAVTAAIIFLFL